MNTVFFAVSLLAAIVDGRDLPIEGRAYDDVDGWYDRLPSGLTTNVNASVHWLKHCTAGMQFRFSTDSTRLVFRWVPYSPELAMDHMPSTGVSGIDVYRFDVDSGRWIYRASGRITDAAGATLETGWNPGEQCLVNLPLYNGLKSFSLEIDDGAKIEPLPPRKSGVEKPVVFYGTSITQGGCCSRPGMAFVNILGRKLDVPVVDLGFSGSGVMEYELSDHIARIDASCYVIDSLWNMDDAMVASRYEPFVRNLRAKRPDVPIVMAEQCDVFCSPSTPKDGIVRSIYEKLLSEGWTKLVYLPKTDMFSGDCEGTVDGCHPNDLGMMSLADAFAPAISAALGLE